MLKTSLRGGVTMMTRSVAGEAVDTSGFEELLRGQVSASAAAAATEAARAAEEGRVYIPGPRTAAEDAVRREKETGEPEHVRDYLTRCNAHFLKESAAGKKILYYDVNS